ncbi:hypothetical protein JX265_005017 [Neoarthrinium moseri]|uniref:DUF7918 domain-containing protein n=1 Tax=Neoarthrinium moseri TaxID=1658444 RepID=A0A9P9WP05_9PEZI|nr:hypothetical protein JX265_005017 [Neoarthrinium moseri]
MVRLHNLGLQAQVHVGGKAATEYDAPSENAAAKSPQILKPLSVTKYIECFNDAEFSVALSVSNHYGFDAPVPHMLNIAIYVDGNWVTGEMCRMDQTELQPWKAIVHGRSLIKGKGKGRGQGKQGIQTFKFKSIKTVDDDDSIRVDSDCRAAVNMGTVDIKFFRVQVNGSSEKYMNNLLGAKNLELAEKALKGRTVSHGTTFSDFVELDKPKPLLSSKCALIYGDNGPFATIKLIYRSKDALIKEGIVSRPPNPRAAALELQRIEELSEDQLRLLLERLKKISTAHVSQSAALSSPDLSRLQTPITNRDGLGASISRFMDRPGTAPPRMPVHIDLSPAASQARKVSGGDYRSTHPRVQTETPRIMQSIERPPDLTHVYQLPLMPLTPPLQSRSQSQSQDDLDRDSMKPERGSVVKREYDDTGDLNVLRPAARPAKRILIDGKIREVVSLLDDDDE